MNEFVFILGILSWAVACGMTLALMKDGYYGIIRFKNRRIRKRIDILYRIGMVESANILHKPLLKKDWRSY